MPKFTIKLWIINKSGVPIKAHVGASLVGADHMEYYNTSEDITQVFPVGHTLLTRYLTSDLGRNQKYVFFRYKLTFKYCSLFTCSFNYIFYFKKMKITLYNHSPSTKISDLLLLIFSISYFIAGLCFAKDLFACAMFLISVICIIIIKYFKLLKNEE